MSTSADTNDIEEGLAFQPKFDASGLVTCVATDAATGEVLMVAHMNDEALRKTIASGEAWYFSRSRNALWRKGETSGHVQRVVEMRMDCDQDAVWIRVEQIRRGLPHRPPLVLLPRGDGRRGRGATVVRGCRQGVRSEGGLSEIGSVSCTRCSARDAPQSRDQFPAMSVPASAAQRKSAAPRPGRRHPLTRH